MNDETAHSDDPLDRLADRALEGVSDTEPSTFESDNDDLALAAAALSLAFEGQHLDPLPESLRAKVEQQAVQFFAPTVPLSSRSTGRRVLAWTGWLAAAASWLVAAWMGSRPRAVEKVVEVRYLPIAAQSDRQPDAQPIPKNPSDTRTTDLKATDHPLARGARGKLVWNQAAQEGVLELEGLAGVDPKRGIYQLWIFDDKRDKRYPVDGGTFTVSNSEKEVSIPVKSRLSVNQPTLFAITLEPPGGVVVSDRQRILLTAAWP